MEALTAMDAALSTLIAPDKVNDRDADGCTLLIHAVFEQKPVEEIQSILNAGANPNAQDNEQRTALHHACEINYLEGVRVLINCPKTKTNLVDVLGRTTLHVAVENRNRAITKLLIDSGASVNILDHEGSSPLHVAVMKNNLELAIALVENGALLHAADKQGQTPASLMPQLVEIQQRLLESDISTVLNAEAAPGHRLNCLKSLWRAAHSTETHRALIENLFSNSSSKEVMIMLLTSSDMTTRECAVALLETLCSIVSTRQSLIKVGIIRVLCVCISQAIDGQIERHTRLLRSLIRLDESGDALKRLFSQCVGLLVSSVKNPLADHPLEDCLYLIAKCSKTTACQVELIERGSVELMWDMLQLFLTSSMPQSNVVFLMLLLHILANLAENSLSHHRFIEHEICSKFAYHLDLLPRNHPTRKHGVNRQDFPPSMIYDAIRLAVYIGQSDLMDKPPDGSLNVFDDRMQPFLLDIKRDLSTADTELSMESSRSSSIAAFDAALNSHSEEDASTVSSSPPVAINTAPTMSSTSMTSLSSPSTPDPPPSSRRESAFFQSLNPSTSVTVAGNSINDWFNDKIAGSLRRLNLSPRKPLEDRTYSNSLPSSLSKSSPSNSLAHSDDANLPAGVEQCRAGTLPSLLKQLISSTSADSSGLKAFLLMFRTFASSIVLLRLLLHAYDSHIMWQGTTSRDKGKENEVKTMPTSSMRLKDRLMLSIQQTIPSSIQERVLEVVSVWALRHLDDFECHPLMFSLVEQLLQKAMADAAMINQIYITTLHTLLQESQRMLLRSDEDIRPTLCNHNDLYLQASQAVSKNILPVTEDEGIVLAALSCQIELQTPSEDISEDAPILSMFDQYTRKFLPENIYETRNVSKRIMLEHGNLRGVSSKDCKHRYLEACRQLPTYSYHFFACRQQVKEKTILPRRIGVGLKGVMLLDFMTNRVIQTWDFSHIHSWAFTSKFLFLKMAEQNSDEVVDHSFMTKAGDRIINFLKIFSSGNIQNLPEPEIVLDIIDSDLCPPDPILGDIELSLNNITTKALLTIPEEFARQMTVLEHQLFQSIPLSAMVATIVKQKSGIGGAPPDPVAVKSLIAHFNHMSEWVSSELVSEQNDEERINMLHSFILTAKLCRRLNNFNGVMEILSGLNSSAVRKLKATWEALPKKDHTIIQELEALMDPRSNFIKYRETLQEATKPCLPYFGVYLTDLTFLEDGNADMLPDGRINYAKRTKMAAVLREIEGYQTSNYLFQVIPDIQNFLKTVQSIEENERYGMAKRLAELRKSMTRPMNSAMTRVQNSLSTLMNNMDKSKQK